MPAFAWAAAGFAFAILANSSLVAQTVIYRETFPFTWSGTPSGQGWQEYSGSTAALNASGPDIFNGTGAPATPSGTLPVNANTAGWSQTSPDLGFFRGFNLGGVQALIRTSEYSFTLGGSGFALNSLSFVSANANSLATRFALQVDSQWYVSDATFTPPLEALSSNFGNTAQTFTLAVNGSTLWRTLSFTAGSVLGTPGGSTTTLPTSGTVNSFGFYINAATGTYRYDSYTIHATAVPEPGTLAMLVLGLGCCVVFLRFRAWKSLCSFQRE